jgi:Transposase DDE domain
MIKRSALIEAIEEDFKHRLPGYHKSRREGLTMLAGVMLETRSANLMELAAALPRDIGTADHRYQYIERQLKNREINAGATIKSYALQAIKQLASHGQTIVLQMDQSHINGANEVLMLSVRLRKRAVPVAWRVRSTQGNIGFAVQKDLLDSVRAWLPQGVSVMLAADRFYGTAQLIGWCQKAGWSYRIRLKGNLTLAHDGGELTTGDVAAGLPKGVTGAELYGSGVSTNIGVLHEKGHKEPWIIAMDANPSQYTVLDYAMRWGIETMFSDFKSRGFGLTHSHIHKPDRLERLILIMSIALYWAISCGMFAEHQATACSSKRGR